MRSALLVLVGVHALLGCGGAPSRREPVAAARAALVTEAAPEHQRLETSAAEARDDAPWADLERVALRSPEEKERVALRSPGSQRAREGASAPEKARAPASKADSKPDAALSPRSSPMSSPMSSNERAPDKDKERALAPKADRPVKGRPARSVEADCEALGPEVQKASRMIEVLRESDLSTPPEVLLRIADRLDLWAGAPAVRLADPELAREARHIRESFDRTSTAIRKLRASLILNKPNLKKAGAARAGLERELDKDAKVVRSIVGRCKSNPYEPIKGKSHIPPHVVRRVVQENFGAMRACYEKGLRQNPKLEGRIPVHLAVDGQGKVTYAGDADRPPADAPLLIALPSPGAAAPSSPAPPLRDEKVIGCVLEVFRGLRFPSAADRKSVATVVYPVVFGVDDNRSSATSAR
ncbi:AgmX/PglI C-terminal domain-containing protein [Sorangium sp. So ce1153]|uniref:AgmX/PglI C-terminal domain-containing protein n=1 Tax=Sorangium sp. So ce1153 TaxID=3133333 RepID=UPI003F61518C